MICSGATACTCTYRICLLMCAVALQPAQAVRWSHWLLGHAAAWQRDDMRLRDLMPRVATLPLGSGALLAQTSAVSTGPTPPLECHHCFDALRPGMTCPSGQAE